MLNKMLGNQNILILGSSGLIGSAVCRRLSNYNKVHKPIGLDFRDKDVVDVLFEQVKPDLVFHLASLTSTGAKHSQHGKDIGSYNITIDNNVIAACLKHKVGKIITPGSVANFLETSNSENFSEEDYPTRLTTTDCKFNFYTEHKVATLEQLKLLQKAGALAFSFPIVTNCFGKHDYFGLAKGNFIPVTIRRLHNAKINNNERFNYCGAQNKLIDFINSDDVADALVLLSHTNYSGIFNVASGVVYTLREVVDAISTAIEFNGYIDERKIFPCDLKSKSINIDKILDLGWKPKFDLQAGIDQTVKWFQSNLGVYRGLLEFDHPFMKNEFFANHD